MKSCYYKNVLLVAPLLLSFQVLPSVVVLAINVESNGDDTGIIPPNRHVDSALESDALIPTTRNTQETTGFSFGDEYFEAVEEAGGGSSRKKGPSCPASRPNAVAGTPDATEPSPSTSRPTTTLVLEDSSTPKVVCRLSTKSSLNVSTTSPLTLASSVAMSEP